MRAHPSGARAPSRPPRSTAHPRGQRIPPGLLLATAVADASEIVRTCEGCYFYTRKTNLPAHALQMIPVTWLFAVWGLDIVGPFQKAPRATPTCWLPSTSFPSGRGAPDHKSQGIVGRDVLHQHHLPVRGA
jgi:hypothetical protein